MSVDVKSKQQVSSGGLGSGPAPEFCAGPTSPLSRSLSTRARCALSRTFTDVNTDSDCWKNYPRPS